MIILFIIAVLLLIASLAVHFSTYFGINPGHVYPKVWLLHILIFAVLIPALLYCQYISKKENVSQSEINRNSPRWMIVLLIVFFAYAIFNFAFYNFVLSGGGVAAIIDGKKVLHSHATIIRELDDKE